MQCLDVLKSFEILYISQLKLLSREELYFKIIFTWKLPEKANVIIRTADTDVLAITLGSIHLLADMCIWMEVGKFTDNSLRFISKSLGDRLCKALSVHAFTSI